MAWEEGGKLPDVVIELLSDTTESVDRGVKMKIYAEQMRVPVYLLYHPLDKRFEGYSLDPRAELARKLAEYERRFGSA